MVLTELKTRLNEQRDNKKNEIRDMIVMENG